MKPYQLLKSSFSLMILGITISLALLPTLVQSASFPVFDATFYKNKPDLSKSGMRPFSLWYAVNFWEPLEDRSQPNEAKIASAAKKIRSDLPLCVDIEEWPVTGSRDVVRQTVEKYIKVASILRQNNPSVKFGFYGVIPIQDYGRGSGNKGRKAFDTWTRDNDKLKSISEYVDVIYPSLYAFSYDQQKWVNYAVASIAEARKHKKPVYVFLWPKFHDNSRLSGQYINGDFWRVQLNTSMKYADGIVIWGGTNEAWDENAAWWLETKKFLSSN